ncbi:effector-associated domain EAD1-containing protein [Catellatospora coxensis]|uniref:CHAT domain-containing protein n=1 Tax=Catellatospora coxensis TaxID=310354 RepID=A0A8J3LDY1_9ACTN|nr:effector-associated domain EAD1-containing protein [Catellatospora coxensis]GIG10935.1 hypothetical protein Cco03nite_76350 [Catellatospora coxensis]
MLREMMLDHTVQVANPLPTKITHNSPRRFWESFLMPQGFSDLELSELARIYPPGGPANMLFRAAGFNHAELPTEVAGQNRIGWWQLTNEIIETGSFPDARRRILRVVCQGRPENQVLCRHTAPTTWRALFLGASPSGTQPIAADRELSLLVAAGIQTESCAQATVRDLDRVLVEPRPHILHVSCHANGPVLVFDNGHGEPVTLHAEDIAGSLRLFAGQHGVRLRAVVVNACRSQDAARCLRGLADVIVAHGEEITDDEATGFADALYGVLGSGLADEVGAAAMLAADRMARGDSRLHRLRDGLVVLR